jgi:subtilisin-like proprotein convertase family protein
MHDVTPGSGQYVPVSSYAPDSAVALSTTFGSMSGSGIWTLFLADTATGGQSTVVSWGLDLGITAVPEPVNVALGLFGGVFALVTAVRWRLRRNGGSV